MSEEVIVDGLQYIVMIAMLAAVLKNIKQFGSDERSHFFARRFTSSGDFFFC